MSDDTPSDSTTTVSQASSDGDPTATDTTTGKKVKKVKEKKVKVERDKPRRELPTISLNRVRTVVAQLVFLVCVVFALILAIAVLLIAIKANPDNDLVHFIGKFSGRIDLGFFSLTDPVKDFDQKKGVANDVKTALFNYGICAVVWLVIGKIVDRIVRP